jgi:hypothetical protein
MADPGEGAPAPGPYLQAGLRPPFKEAEDRLERVIRDRFRIRTDVPEIKPLDLGLEAWSPDEAAHAFAQRYADLDARR